MIQNVTLTNANTEYSIELAEGVSSYSIQCRTAYDIRFSEETGKVATPTAPWATIKSGAAFNCPPHSGLSVGSRTLYFASAQAGVVVEVISYR